MTDMHAGWTSFRSLLKDSGPWASTARLVVPLLVVGIASVILWGIYPDPRIPILGAVFGLILLAIVRLLHALQKQPAHFWTTPAQIFLWFCLFFFMSSTGVLGSALLLGIPKATREMIDRNWPSPNGLTRPSTVGIPGFQINRSQRILDLRALQPIAPGHENEATSKAIWTNTFFLKRMRTEGKDFVIPYGSSGVRVDVRSTTNPFTSKLTSPGAVRQFGPMLRTRGELHIDLSALPIDMETAVQEEAIYWNAFQGKTRDWAAVRTTYQEGSIDFTILFPPNKPCKGYKLAAYPNTDNARYEQVEGIPDVQLSQDGLTLHWHIPVSQLNYCYRIDWDW